MARENGSSKHALLASLLAKLNIADSPDYYSRGGTVTMSGLRAIQARVDQILNRLRVK